MKAITRLGLRCLSIMMILVALPAVVHAQFTCSTNNGMVAITKYTGSGGAVTIPAKTNGLPITSIDAGAFADCGVTSVLIPNSVTQIKEGAFSRCGELSDITIPNSVTSIGFGAFELCASLKNITIPAGVTDIGVVTVPIGTPAVPAWTTPIATPYTFKDCSKLAGITVDAANSVYSSVNGILFDKNQTRLILCPAGYVGACILPASVTCIGNDAFMNCQKLSGVYFKGNAPQLNENEFAGDYNTTIYYLPGTTGWTNTFGERPTAIWNPQAMPLTPNPVQAQFTCTTNNSKFTFTTNNGKVTITDYSGLGGSVTIPSTLGGGTVTSIGSHAFEDRTSLTDVTIPNTVTSIGDNAFSGCSRLTNVTIPNSVTSIESNAFSCCHLVSVTIPDSVTNIGDHAFLLCNGLTNIAVNSSNAFYSSVSGVLFDKSQSTLIQYPKWLSGSYTIPNGVTCIRMHAFCFSTRLTSITIPDSVTNIEWCAFLCCTDMTNATVGTSIISIEESAFANCLHLKSIYFKGNAPTLGTKVFDRTDEVTTYYLPATKGWTNTFGGRPTAIWKQ